MDQYLEETQRLEKDFEGKLQDFQSIKNSIDKFITDMKSLLSFEDTYTNIHEFTKSVIGKQKVRKCMPTNLKPASKNVWRS